jgi:hypothetical protein
VRGWLDYLDIFERSQTAFFFNSLSLWERAGARVLKCRL